MVNEARTTATRPAPRRPPRRAGERGRSARHHEDRWTDIVERAGAIFYRKGYEAASLQDIADAVGMLEGTFAICGLGGPRWRGRDPV